MMAISQGELYHFIEIKCFEVSSSLWASPFYVHICCDAYAKPAIVSRTADGITVSSQMRITLCQTTKYFTYPPMTY